ncbi:cell division protein ZapB [Neobacillus mesonae]|nr:cell division protein ZapB [Neobacillus mesonae]
MGKASRRPMEFTPAQLYELKQNPNVSSVDGRIITYTPVFKVAAIRADQDGIRPREIFIRGGFSLEMIGTDTPKRCLQRWREIFEKYGEKGLMNEGRQRHNRKEWTLEEKLQDKINVAEEQIRLLKDENAQLKRELRELQKLYAEKPKRYYLRSNMSENNFR